MTRYRSEAVLDFVFKPLRAVLGTAEREVDRPLVQTEHDILDSVQALHRATESIEHHVEVIENLATSIDPLRDSVNNLTATMDQLVAVLAPLASAERGVKDIEHEVTEARHLFGRRHKNSEPPES